MAQQDDEQVKDDEAELDTKVGGDSQQETDEDQDDSDDEKSDDESGEEEDDSDDSEEEDDSADEDSDDDEEEDESDFEKRFPRFKGETLPEYTKNLEEGYENSSKQALKLKHERDQAVAEREEWKKKAMTSVAKDDKTGDDNKDDENNNPPAEDPAISWAKQQRDKAFVGQFRDFAKVHPLVDENSDEFDQMVFEELDAAVADMTGVVAKRLGRTPELSEVLEAAWPLVAPKEDSKERKVASTLKKDGASSKNKSVKKGDLKQQFTPSQIANARKMDPDLKDKSDSEVAKELAKYQ